MNIQDWQELVNRTRQTKFRLEWKDFIKQLPSELPEQLDVYAVGGITEPGWTEHDLDFIIDKDKWHEFSLALGVLLEQTFGVPCHVGWKIADMEPAPVAVKIYSNGKLLKDLKTKVVMKTEKPVRRPKWILDLITARR